MRGIESANSFDAWNSRRDCGAIRQSAVRVNARSKELLERG
jgi:hypothetical protein